MHRRQRQHREMAGWQCAAGRAILRLEAREFAPLCGTTKNTVLRFENGEFMPRPVTVLAIEHTLRELGVHATFDMRGEPKGVNLVWAGYGAAYPVPERKHRPRPEDHGRRYRERALAAAALPQVQQEAPRSQTSALTIQAQQPSIATLEAQQAQLMAELAQLRLRVTSEDDDADF